MIPEATSLHRRIAAYLVVLIGHLLYCKNFSLVDYVRPYSVSDYAFALTKTATFSMAANIDITIGARG